MPSVSNDWKDWLDQYGAALLLLARQWVTSYPDAEDVVQEAFVRFWKSRQRANDPAAYLFASVKTCAFDWQRARHRQTRREAVVARPECEPLFVGSLEHNERRALVQSALGRLPQEQREVLVMKIWGGLSFPQIAEALQISANTAASRYRYALAKLREQLAEEAIP
jgi:RNA polymerase sigma-70 factor (ECF subfamily)